MNAKEIKTFIIKMATQATLERINNDMLFAECWEQFNYYGYWFTINIVSYHSSVSYQIVDSEDDFVGTESVDEITNHFMTAQEYGLFYGLELEVAS
jgi:hypothetical protein